MSSTSKSPEVTEHARLDLSKDGNAVPLITESFRVKEVEPDPRPLGQPETFAG